MNTDFFATVRNFKFTSRQHRVSDDDAVDRINSFYTPVLIIILSSLIGAKMYIVGDPIQCWIPPEFHSSWEQFAENYCWVKNTYFVSPDDDVPDSRDHREKQELTYYQWVPFVLALQALMFYIPGTFWKLLNWQSGIHIKSLVQMAIGAINGDPTKRDEEIKCLARHMDYAISAPRSTKFSTSVKIKRLFLRLFMCGYTKTGNYLTFIYMITKLLYIANVVGQFFILNAFLNTSYEFYGLGVLRDLWQGHDWRHSGHFPRVTMCDFDIRVLGNRHPRSLQCVLVINLFNEKVYIFLWFWFAFVAIVTILDSLSWFIWGMFPQKRFAAVKRYLSAIDDTDIDRNDARNFIFKYLYSDGAFVLRLLAKNAGEPVVQDLVKHLWEKFEKKEDEVRRDERDKYERKDRKPLLNDMLGGESKGVSV